MENPRAFRLAPILDGFEISEVICKQICSTHHWRLVQSARAHLAYTVCRLLSHPHLKMRISRSNLAGSESWRLAGLRTQARPRFEYSPPCATLSGAVHRKQAIDQRSAHIRTQQSPSRWSTRLRLSHSSPDRCASCGPFHVGLLLYVELRFFYSSIPHRPPSTRTPLYIRRFFAIDPDG